MPSELDNMNRLRVEAVRELADLQERHDEYVLGSQRADEHLKRRIAELESKLEEMQFSLGLLTSCEQERDRYIERTMLAESRLGALRRWRDEHREALYSDQLIELAELLDGVAEKSTRVAENVNSDSLSVVEKPSLNPFPFCETCSTWHAPGEHIPAL